MLTNYYDLRITLIYLFLVQLSYVDACSPLSSSSTTTFTCKYNNKTLDNCNNLIEGTTAFVTCKEFYEESTLKMNFFLTCRESGWDSFIPQCYPICGEKRSKESSNRSSDQNVLLDNPWHVGIYDNNKELLCGGTLIEMNIILTTAECLTLYYHNTIYSANSLLVASGKYFSKYNDSRDKFSQYSKVDKIKIPEGYKGPANSYAFNVAILVLKDPFLPSQVVKPACIDFNHVPHNLLFQVNGIITGWGSSFQNKMFTDILKETEILYIPQNKCSSKIQKRFLKLITFDKICEDYLDKAKTVCNGDNGGGLVFKNLITSRYYITGIASLTPTTHEGKCDPNQFSISTLIYHYKNLLQEYLPNNRIQSCQLPHFPSHGMYAIMNPGLLKRDRMNDTIARTYKPGHMVPPNTKLRLTCNFGYNFSSPVATQFYCSKNGNWTPAPTGCIRLLVQYEIVSHTNKPLGYNYIQTILIIAVAVFFIIALVAIIVLNLQFKKEAQLRRELKLAGLDTFRYGNLKKFNPELGIGDQAELLPYNNNYEFPIDKLKLGKQLGFGAFGTVMKAKAFGIISKEERTTVAVKTVRDTADNIQLKALISELKIMIHLGQHLNVVNLLGACTQNITQRELLVIVEYCPFGNLYNYLLRNRSTYVDQIDTVTGSIDYSLGSEDFEDVLPISNNSSSNSKMCCNKTRSESISNYCGDDQKSYKPLFTTDIISWSFQVARGMEYLSSRKIIHGDLAARNILLAKNNIVKICDFGLAKRMYRSANYKMKKDCPLPIKWMAIESIRDGVFSAQSDVWSYGILLWEFFSLAQSPYPGMEADERLYYKLEDGYKMESPPYAPKEMYKIMRDCWNVNPESRPSFNKLAGTVGLLLEENVRQHYIDLNDPYFIMNTQRLNEGEKDYLAILGDGGIQSRSIPNNYFINVLKRSTSIESSGNVYIIPIDLSVDKAIQKLNEEENYVSTEITYL